jgi:hypothetical protein
MDATPRPRRRQPGLDRLHRAAAIETAIEYTCDAADSFGCLLLERRISWPLWRQLQVTIDELRRLRKMLREVDQ